MDDEIEKVGEIRLTPSPEDVKNFIKSMDKTIEKFLKKKEKDN